MQGPHKGALVVRYFMLILSDEAQPHVHMYDALQEYRKGLKIPFLKAGEDCHLILDMVSYSNILEASLSEQ